MNLLNSNSSICKNGHYLAFVTDKYCPKCGVETITLCPKCSEKIPGLDMTPLIKNYKVPSYCAKCGEPYPWTQATLDVSEQIIHEDEDLTEEDMKEFCACIPDLLVTTPKTSLAVIRYSKFIKKATGVTATALYDLLKDIVCDVAKDKLL